MRNLFNRKLLFGVSFQNKFIIVLLKSDLINVCVGVIRYYGGVNLGTGGLARAYSGTAKMALDLAVNVPFVEMQEVSLTIQYHRVDELTRAVTQLKGRIIDKSFAEVVQVKISLPALEVANLMSRFG